MKYDIVSSFGSGNTQVLQSLREISEISLSTDEECCFSLEKFKENNPFNVLTIACALRQFRRIHPNNRALLEGNCKDSFLSHIGFYDMVGADYGKKLGAAKPSDNYVPIRMLKFNDSFYNDIESNSECLARLLHFDKDLEEFVKYAFIETIRNVYEHAKTDRAYVCAQKWPTMGIVEIAIVDMGCGIAKAMEPRFPRRDEKSLLYLSAEPGVSAKSNHSYLDSEDGWRNSGYGLYTLRKLSVAYGGSFLLCSGNVALRQKRNEIQDFLTSFSGTAVALRIRTDMHNDFKKVRRSIIVEGENAAKLEANAITTASNSSGGHYK